jgi:hypothetical protein
MKILSIKVKILSMEVKILSNGGDDDSQYHADLAWFSNIVTHSAKTERAAYAVVCAGDRGLTATELSVFWREPEHRSCGSALSRARRKYPDQILYRKQEGETHGRYYWRRFLMPRYLEAHLREIQEEEE